VPLYDNGVYMGVLSVRNISAGGRLAEEGWNRLAELGNAVQSKINQQRHDMNSRAKAEFLSRMSHEIRTPMNSIIGMTAIALQENQSRERMLDCLRKIKNSSDFLLGLINDFLDMSKLESGEVQLEAVDFSMKELLDTTVELFTPQVEEKSLELIQDISLKHEWFEGDRLRITQILANLMDNAVKFTGGHGKVVLAVREEPLDPETAKLFFSVRDTGMGIGKQEQARISRYFEQEDEDVITFSKGTGLGLTICSRLAKLMGSRLELESEPGVGSVFGFALILPFGRKERNREEKISFDGFRVLVVEDNELNAEIAQSILEDYHFAVDCVYDGAQALERIRESEPGTYDLVLMDILMPVMDGLDATRAIRALDREDCKTLPIVAMSANVFDDDLKKAEECGMNGHLSKPVEIDKLYQMLKKILSGKKKVD
jgi:signal transduction histidine kinase/ActR/RegA family two-component response regulator